MERPDYSLLDTPAIIQFMFYPRSDWLPPPPGATDYAFPAHDGTTLAGRFYPHSKHSPSILFFHGNGEVAHEYDGIAGLYNHIGTNLFVADFRGYGKSEGSPTVSNLVADSHATLDGFAALLREQGCSGPVYVMGRSLGAYCAVELAVGCGDRIRGFILESGSANITGVMRHFNLGPVPGVEELARRHWDRVSRITLPLLTIHGDMDTLVPMERASELYEAVASEDKTFVTIRGAGHNDIMLVDTDRYFQAVRDFVHAERQVAPL